MNRLEREIVNLKERNARLLTEIKDIIKENQLRKEQEKTHEKELRNAEELIKEYEKKLSKEREPRTTLGQKMALLDHFKILDFINELKLEQTYKYKLLSYILDAHEKNVAANYNTRGSHPDSTLNNASNNKFLVKVFHEFKMEGAEILAQQRLDNNS